MWIRNNRIRDSTCANRDFPLQNSWELPIFAAEKKRKGQDMLELMMILGAAAIGLGVGLMSKQEPEKSYRPKKKNFFVRLGETGDPVHFSK